MSILFREERQTLDRLTDELTIAIVSDTHVHSKKTRRMLREAIDEINRRDVDLIFLVGDYLNNSRNDLSDLAPLAELESRYGSYAVLGNHDYDFIFPWDDPNEDHVESLVDTLEGAGVDVLLDESVRLETHAGNLDVVGLQSHWHGIDYDAAFEDVEEENLTLLLTHHPHAVDDIPQEYDTDLIFAGHTHGYNIRWPSGNRPLLPFIRPWLGGPFDRGFADYDGRLMYVTSGLGQMPPLPRIFNPAEVVFLDLVPE